MKKSGQPGIDFVKLILEKAILEVNPNYEQTEEDIPVDFSLTVNPKLDKARKLLKLNLEVIVFKETENPPLRVSVLAAGYFSVKKDEDIKILEEFSRIQGPALVFPFIREVIANLTMRTGYPPLLIPPMNLVSLIGKSGKIKKRLPKRSKILEQQ